MNERRTVEKLDGRAGAIGEARLFTATSLGYGEAKQRPDPCSARKYRIFDGFGQSGRGVCRGGTLDGCFEGSFNSRRCIHEGLAPMCQKFWS
jgi:hypothetical protein